jgi:hypothetical protein
MMAAMTWWSVAVMVPLAGTMVSWSSPLEPDGGCDGDDGVEEPCVVGLRRGLTGSSGEWRW